MQNADDGGLGEAWEGSPRASATEVTFDQTREVVMDVGNEPCIYVEKRK